MGVIRSCSLFVLKQIRFYNIDVWHFPGVLEGLGSSWRPKVSEEHARAEALGSIKLLFWLKDLALVDLNYGFYLVI